MAPEAGFYDDGSGRQRWWDGAQWTEKFADGAPPEVAAPVKTAYESKSEQWASQPGTLWSAIGKPLSGMGAGRYRLTQEFLFFEKGTLSTKSQQIHTHEIHDVDAAQSMTQKARSVGNVTLHAKRTGGDEMVVLEDIPNFREGVRIINETAHAARLAISERERTQHVNYQGGAPAFAPAAPAPAPAAAPAAGVDLNVELAKLVAFRDSGAIDEEEFKAGKRKLLGL